MRRRTVTAPAALLAAVVAGPLAATTPAPAASAAATLTGPEYANAKVAYGVRHQLVASGFGSAASVLVTDEASGGTVFGSRTTTPRLPASNEKLVTAYVALSSLGPSTRIRTSVRRLGSSVYLVGGGDPGLTSSRVRALAATTAQALRASGTTSAVVRVDDHLFPPPTNASGWKAEWVPTEVAPVRALVVDGRNLLDTSLDAGATFAAALKANGVNPSPVARATAPSTSVVVASSLGETVGRLVQVMVHDSENDYAEALHRLASIARGRGAGWSGANANAASVLAAAGVPLSGVAVADGSGLSLYDRQTNVSLLAVLRVLRRDATTSSLLFSSAGLPLSGWSGTLKDRFLTAPTSCARGRLRAKTGSLDTVTDLSGLATGVDGRIRLFSVLVNGPRNDDATVERVDRVAAATTGCLL